MSKDNREQLLTELLEESRSSNKADEKLNIVMSRLDLIMDAIVVQQKDAAKLAGCSSATIVNKTRAGEIQPLQADGSRLNYYTLRDVEKLKRRNVRKR